jgi:hypothetical protein
LGSGTVRAMIDGGRVGLAEWVQITAADWLSCVADRALAFILRVGADRTPSLSEALTLTWF